MGKRRPQPPDAMLPGEQATVREVGTLLRAWWKARTLAAIDRAQVPLPQAWADLQFFVCAYLIRRLTDEKTPEDVRDAIALRLSPQLGILLKGGATPDREREKAIGNPMSEAHEVAMPAPAPTPGDGSVASLLLSYGVTKTPQ